ncbi:MAG: YafY family transcriptional regulator [Sulfuricella sp.]|nr:YafY family transcriptional regulator [Sulfuricella sp.]
MRRADRLFQIIQHLRGRRLTTARHLAERLEVSERTIYRDIRDLTLSGVPIEGEAGVGYVLRKGFDLPPLMFSRDEVEALVVGARMAQAWGGRELARAASRALEKIEAVLPAERSADVNRCLMFALNFRDTPQLGTTLEQVRQALNQRNLLRFSYTREDGERSERTVAPLGLYFWGAAWTLAAWCELRGAFRHFRIDRMESPAILEETFSDTPGRTLEDFLRHVKAQG